MGSWICHGHWDSQMYCWLICLPHHCPTPNTWLVDRSYLCIHLRPSAETSVVLLFLMNNIPSSLPGPECLHSLLLLQPSRCLSSLCSWQTEPQWFLDLLALILCSYSSLPESTISLPIRFWMIKSEPPFKVQLTKHPWNPLWRNILFSLTFCRNLLVPPISFHSFCRILKAYCVPDTVLPMEDLEWILWDL